MRCIAISGHRGLPAGTAGLIREAITGALDEQAGQVTGVSCLADGADQIFARAVLEAGGSIEAVIPASQYRDSLPADSLAEYDALLALAAVVHEMPFRESTSESHMAASEFMLGRAGELWAVWDGKAARGYGGTGDVVAHARTNDIPVRVFWPQGAQRD